MDVEMPTAPLSPCAQFMGVAHLIDKVVAALPRPDQISCLGINRAFFHSAGRAVYHTVNIDGGNMKGFFSGVLDGTVDDTFGCGALKDTGRCEYRDHKEVVVTCGISNAGPHRTTKVVGVTKASKTWAGPVVPDDFDARATLKGQLLQYVRVLTVGSHHRCACHGHAAFLAQLFANVDILRVVPDFGLMFKLNELCDDDDKVCPLLAHVPTRKIVFRNLDFRGLPVPKDSEDQCPAPTIKDVVYFLPNDRRRYFDDQDHDSTACGLAHIGDYFPAAERVKVVFFPEWEGWDDDDDAMGDILFGGTAPLDPDLIVDCLANIAQFPNTKVTVVGLHSLQLDTGVAQHLVGDLFDKRELLSVMQDMVREEAIATTYAYVDVMEYLSDPKARSGELSADTTGLDFDILSAMLDGVATDNTPCAACMHLFAHLDFLDHVLHCAACGHYGSDDEDADADDTENETDGDIDWNTTDGDTDGYGDDHSDVGGDTNGDIEDDNDDNTDGATDRHDNTDPE